MFDIERFKCTMDIIIIFVKKKQVWPQTLFNFDFKYSNILRILIILQLMYELNAHVLCHVM